LFFSEFELQGNQEETMKYSFLKRRAEIAVWGLLSVLALVLVFEGLAWAQTATTGDIIGVVTDPSNAVVPDARVTLKDNSKGGTQDTTTSKDGAYRFHLLTPGSYTISATATGFKTVTRQITVALGQIADGNVQLPIGSSSTSVTVTEIAPLVQTENGDTSTALSQQQVQNVPNPGNDLSAIAQLAPGAVMNTQGGYGNVEAFGLPATSNLFTMDGMDDNDPFLNLNNSGASNLLLGSNEIQEADVVTNGYSASFGTFGGINVNYVTKSGGNQFHGNGVYYWNGRVLNAEDWFSKAAGEARPFDNANQWASSLGGPVKKDKIFFFVNTEGLRVLIPVPSTVFVPTTAFEAATVQNLTNLGDTASIPYYCQNLAGICPGVGGVTGSGAGIFNLFNGAKNLTKAVDNLPPGASLGDGCSNVGATGAFAGFSGPCAESVLENPVNFAQEWQLAGRMDWNIGTNDRAYLRVQYDTGDQPTFTDPVNSTFNAASHQPEWQGQLNETHTFNPTMSNQFLLAATWYTAIFEEPSIPQALATFPTSLTIGDSSLGYTADCGVGLACDDFIWPQGRNVTQFQIADDVSKTIGRHTLRFGGKYHRNYVSDHDFGFFVSGLQVPFSLQDFVNGGDPAGPNAEGGEFIQDFPKTLNAPIRLYEIAGYIQDEWRVKPNLTITPALRLEHASNPVCVTNCFAQLSETLSEISANPGQAYNKIIQANRQQALLGYQNLQWEPRIGFAWQPFGTATGMAKSDFVVRGGIGIFYDVFPGQISDDLNQNVPLDNGFTILSANSGAPGATCPGFLSPNQSPGSNLFDCATAANAAFLAAFNSGANTVAAVPNFTYSQPKTEAPQYQKWSLEIQKGFGRNDSIDIGYYGTHGIHEPIFNNSMNAFGFGTLPAVAPTAQFIEVNQEQSVGISNYNGLVASFRHRFSGWGGGGEVAFNYTYSKALDEVSNGGFNNYNAISIEHPEDPFNLRTNYGPADYDARHVVNANYVWELPLRKAFGGHGWAPLVDGWQISGAVFFRTGFPYTIIDGELDRDLGGNNYDAAVWVNPLSSVPVNCAGQVHAGPNAVPCYTVSTATTTGEFPAPATETGFGRQGLRNAYRGPQYFDTDFSFVKKTKVPGWERAELQLGLQFFNLLNHPNFNLPINDISNGLFGTIQSAVSPPTSILGSFLGGDASPRLIQVKAQFVF
jgi:hypothetical protein